MTELRLYDPSAARAASSSKRLTRALPLDERPHILDAGGPAGRPSGRAWSASSRLGSPNERRGSARSPSEAIHSTSEPFAMPTGRLRSPSGNRPSPIERGHSRDGRPPVAERTRLIDGGPWSLDERTQRLGRARGRSAAWLRWLGRRARSLGRRPRFIDGWGAAARRPSAPGRQGDVDDPTCFSTETPLGSREGLVGSCFPSGGARSLPPRHPAADMRSPQSWSPSSAR